MDISEVFCPITEAKYTIVKDQSPESISLFKNWVADLLQRANAAKTINLAIDCEGYMLGSIEKSLGCIQFGEIFNDSYNVRSGDMPPPVGAKPGFIVLFPVCTEVINCIATILSHPYTIIFTFDFTKDFSSMMDYGITLNLNNVFDSQVATSTHIKNHITNTRVRGLKWFVEQARGMDPLADRAMEKLNYGKHQYFDIIMYLIKDKKNRFQEMLSKDLFEMAAADVYMTGLAAVYCINSNLTANTFQQSLQKAVEFFNLIQQCQNYFAPSAMREIAFFNYYRATQYQKPLKYAEETDDNILELLSVFRDTLALINAQQILKGFYNGEMKMEKTKEIYGKVTEILEKNRPRLIELLKKYS